MKGFEYQSSDNISLTLKQVKRQNSSDFYSSNDSILQHNPKQEIFKAKEEQARARLIHSDGAPIISESSHNQEKLSYRLVRR